MSETKRGSTKRGSQTQRELVESLKKTFDSINRRLGSIELRLSAIVTGKVAPFSIAMQDEFPAPQCSFCGKTSREVKVMIAGPVPHFMCCECVGLAAEIVAEHGAASDAGREVSR